MKGWTVLLVAFLGGFLSGSAYAAPDCLSASLRSESDGSLLPINNDQVLQWKYGAIQHPELCSSSQQSYCNGFHARGHVQGTVVRAYPDQTGHSHFSIQIGPQSTDTLEIVYNQDFGTVPTPVAGMPVEACGDYITSIAPTPGPDGKVFEVSPDGAILHWVHEAPGSSEHTSGFLVMGDGTSTGGGSISGQPHGSHHKH